MRLDFIISPRKRINTLFCIFFLSAFSVKAKGPCYRVYGIDSTERQYKITLIRVSNQALYTIYSTKINKQKIEELKKKKFVKIEVGKCYKLRFFERVILRPESRFDEYGNRMYQFDIDRLDGLYYDNTRHSIFRRNTWKAPINKSLRKILKEACR